MVLKCHKQHEKSSFSWLSSNSSIPFLSIEKLDHLFLDDLCKILELSKHEAGMHQVIDPVAIEVLKRRKMKLVVVNGFNPKNVLAAVNGENVGTTID